MMTKTDKKIIALLSLSFAAFIVTTVIAVGLTDAEAAPGGIPLFLLSLYVFGRNQQQIKQGCWERKYFVGGVLYYIGAVYYASLAIFYYLTDYYGVEIFSIMAALIICGVIYVLCIIPKYIPCVILLRKLRAEQPLESKEIITESILCTLISGGCAIVYSALAHNVWLLLPLAVLLVLSAVTNKAVIDRCNAARDNRQNDKDSGTVYYNPYQ